jgi:hypothetical protein
LDVLWVPTGSKLNILLFQKTNFMFLNIYIIRRITTKGFSNIINSNQIIAVSGRNSKIVTKEFDARLFG